MTKKRWYMVGGIAIVVVIAVIVITQIGSARKTAGGLYQTVAVTRQELVAQVGATGTVRANQSAVITWQTTGSVDAVKVKLDDEVKHDQVLATLESSSLPQNVILAKADLVTAQRNLENLRESKAAAAQAQLTLVNAQDDLDKAQRARNNLNYSRSGERADAAYASYLLSENKVDQMQQIYNQFSSRPEDDLQRALALSNLSNAKLERDRALANLNWYRGKADTQEIADADAKLAVAKAAYEDAQREYNRLKNGPDPDDLAAAEARVAALQATMDTAQVVSPFNGTITAVDAKTGDQVNPGTVAFRIDDLSHLLVDVPVSEVDINRIQVGQTATLTFDAMQDKTYEGKVTEVARVGTVDQGAVNFYVTVELVNADENIRPGMTAAVNLVVNKLENVLVVPNRAIRIKDDQRVVYLLQNGAPVAVPIQLGASSDTYSEVISGGQVKEGDLVVLNPPSILTSGGSPSFMGR